MMRHIALSALSLLSACGASDPPDGDLISRINQNKAQFELLKRYAIADRSLGADRIETNDIPRYLSEKHKAAYRNGFEQLGISLIRSFEDRTTGEVSVNFTVNAVGIAVSGSVKEIVWTTGHPKPLIDSLDPPYAKEGYVTETWFDAYRPVSNGWYIHLSSN